MPMSKAFTKETETEDELPDEPDLLPAGVKNYVTPRGLRLLQEELRQLTRIERPKVVETVAWAAGNGDRSENGDYIYGKRRLREIDRRIRCPSGWKAPKWSAQTGRETGTRCFLARPSPYANGRGTEMTITIVGIDEADRERG